MEGSGSLSVLQACDMGRSVSQPRHPGSQAFANAVSLEKRLTTRASRKVAEHWDLVETIATRGEGKNDNGEF